MVEENVSLQYEDLPLWEVNNKWSRGRNSSSNANNGYFWYSIDKKKRHLYRFQGNSNIYYLPISMACHKQFFLLTLYKSLISLTFKAFCNEAIPPPTS